MSRIDEIKRRHEQRKKNPSIKRFNQNKTLQHQQSPNTHSNSPSSGHPLCKVNVFFMKCILAAIIVLVSAILYKTDLLKTYPSAKGLVENSLTKEANFSKISGWYEKTFGEPLAFLPIDKNKVETASEQKKLEFAVPVSGEITEQFSEAKKGVTIKTKTDAEVDAINSGIVISVGNKPDIGKTVVIQHENGEESWYGKLDKIDVKLYDTVEQGQKLGKVVPDGNGKNGVFYFALKDGDEFVDPIQVFAH